MAEPENRLTECDDWFRLRPTPLAMTGFLVQYFRAHFSDPLSVEQLNLFGGVSEPLAIAGAPYTTGPDTFVGVESVTTWRPDLTDKRPAVVVGREEWTPQKVSIGNRLFLGRPNADGSVDYTMLIAGAHTLFCVHRNGAMAEMLGAEVFYELHEFQQSIRGELGLLTFGVAGHGKLFRLEEPKEHYAVPVTVAYVCQHSWRTVPAAPKLKTVRFTSTIP